MQSLVVSCTSCSQLSRARYQRFRPYSRHLSLSSGVWCFSELFFVREPQDVTASRKDAVVLDCQARGEAPITVTWLKNGGKVSENERIYTLSNGSLYISEVEGRKGEQSDEGFYQCLALNKYGAILSQKSHLTLASKCQLLFVNLLPSLWLKLLNSAKQLTALMCACLER